VKASPNVAASVKQRLLNLAKKRGVEFNRLLTWYGIERLLFRLSRSRYEGQFVLKGAMLFHIWCEESHRPTRDVDLLGRIAPDDAALGPTFAEICVAEVEDDGVDFAAESVQTEPIREGNANLGVRIKLMGRLGVARIPLQVDVGFGDSIVPAPETVELPTLLGHATPRLSAYRRETVVAEKLHAIVDLGFTNTRMKDYFDLWFLAANFSFDGATLAGAIAATFNRRVTRLPDTLPTGLTDAFGDDATKQVQWRSFLGRSGLKKDELGLREVVRVIGAFCASPLELASRREGAAMQWEPAGPWRITSEAPEAQ
jgi:predicted nucleotidyltransferase component of viral defense system